MKFARMSDTKENETETVPESKDDSPTGSTTESISSDRFEDIIDNLNISQIDHADSFFDTSSELSDTSSKTSSTSKDSSIKSTDQINEKCEEITKTESKSPENKLNRQKSTDDKSKDGKKGPFAFLRRLSSKESKDVSQRPPSGIMKIRVENLPQVFITKYLGCRPCNGIWGAENTQKPVHDMIEDAKKLGQGKDLSLVKVKVTDQGLEVSSHRDNKGPVIEAGLIPVQYISYGVQDFTFTRVFSFIMVREMSYKAKKMECHAYVCPSTANARKLSLSVALAFKEYAQSLNGKQFRFQVELGDKPVIDDRLPGNQDNDKVKEDEEEC